MNQKRGAVELSIGTIVIVVLAMSMLILGLVLVNKIMCSAIRGIDALDEQMREEMIKLFGENRKIVLRHQENIVHKNLREGYGVAFGIINLGETNPEFSYEITVSDMGTCKFPESKALNFIALGSKGNMNIPSGESYFDLIKFEIPKDIEPCQLKYLITAKNEEQVYASAPINIIISEKPFIRSFC